MQMARIFDNSISGIIRYWGGRNPETGGFEDKIREELDRKLTERRSLNPAEVLVTDSGYLLQNNNVKKIFHVAANYGQVGRGFMPIDDMSSCIENVLREGKNHFGRNEKKDKEGGKNEEERPVSILFPLMGTRSRRGSVMEDRVRLLIDAAVDYLTSNPRCAFRKVYFLAYTDREIALCKDILENDERLGPLTEVRAPEERPISEMQVSQGPGESLRTAGMIGGTSARRDDRLLNPTRPVEAVEKEAMPEPQVSRWPGSASPKMGTARGSAAGPSESAAGAPSTTSRQGKAPGQKPKS